MTPVLPASELRACSRPEVWLNQLVLASSRCFFLCYCNRDFLRLITLLSEMYAKERTPCDAIY